MIIFDATSRLKNELPKTCYDCPFFSAEDIRDNYGEWTGGAHAWCGLSGVDFGEGYVGDETPDSLEGVRHESCPLKEVDRYEKIDLDRYEEFESHPFIYDKKLNKLLLPCKYENADGCTFSKHFQGKGAYCYDVLSCPFGWKYKEKDTYE